MKHEALGSTVGTMVPRYKLLQYQYRGTYHGTYGTWYRRYGTSGTYGTYGTVEN